MHYAVLLQFGAEYEEKLVEYWRWISQNGGNDILFKSGLKPHITLSSFRDTNIDVFCERLHEFAIKTYKFKLTFDSISTFDLNPDVIYLKSSVSVQLENIYNDFHSYFSDIIENINRHCMPENWIPHSAIAIKIKKDTTKTIINNFESHFIPFEIYIEKIALIENNVRKRYLAEYDLKT